MPTDDELLRYIVAPLSYSTWWMMAACVIGAAVLIWWIGILIWTLPAASLRRISVLRNIHRRVVQRKFITAIRNVRTAYRSGEMSQSQACTVMARIMRSFLSVSTGAPIYYMSVDEVGAGPLAAAGPVLARLSKGQFDPSTAVDVDAIGQSAEQVVGAWN